MADKQRAEWLELLLKLISPYDVLAEPRQPNLPGTVDEYPELAAPAAGNPGELRADPRVAEITAAFRASA